MLTPEQIFDRIRNPISKDDLADGVTIQNRHKLHITGEGYSDDLRQLHGFESNLDFNARKQLTDPGTLRLMAIILDNLNRWVTNQGTVKAVKWKQKKQDSEFKKVLDQAWRGSSLENFIATFYKEAIYQEMEGFLVITKPLIIDSNTILREGVEKSWDGKSLDPYIVFYAAEDIHDFHGIGDDLEYIIIKYGEDSEKRKMFRVIDNAQDVIVVDYGDKIAISDLYVKNDLGYVPAIQISNITARLKNGKVKTSPINHVMSDLDRYMKKDSDLIIQMVRHMYPKLASITTACKQCDAQGYNYDAETKIKCPDCNGTGKVIPISRDGVIGMPQYIDEGKTPYPGSPASYIAPDNASLETAIADLKTLGLDILYSATGDKNLITEGLNTATENLINFKGLEDRIAEIVSMVESREEFIIKTIAMMHNDFKNGFEGVAVRYGRRMTVRGESEILGEIKEAKLAGMPSSHISALQKELIYTKYKNNKSELERQLLLADVEPLNGYTVEELMKVTSYVDEMTLKIKFNFSTLIQNFEKKNGPVQSFKPDKEWANRVDDIYNKIKEDEILLVSGVPDDNGGEVIPDIAEDTA